MLSEILREPLGRKLRDTLQCPGFFEQMRRALNDLEGFRLLKALEHFLVDLDDHLIVAADDKERGSDDGAEGLLCQIWTSAS